MRHSIKPVSDRSINLASLHRIESMVIISKRHQLHVETEFLVRLAECLQLYRAFLYRHTLMFEVENGVYLAVWFSIYLEPVA